jgi:AcrR family transcriptional regulator
VSHPEVRRRRVPRAERERQMIAVAERMFAERGFQAVGMDEIAEQVGVSKPMIYEYFGSKEGLFVACIRQARAELLTATTESVAGHTSVEDALRAGLTAFFEFTDSHRRSWQLIRQQQTALDPRLFATYLPGSAAKELEAAAEIIAGACERLSDWYVQQEDVTAEQAAEYVMRLVWFGLRDKIQSA